jgi:PPK2 family polyphosphate:nucleotide phosphotransferase
MAIDLIVQPGKKFLLDSVNPDDFGSWKNRKDEGVQQLTDFRQELDTLQEVLFAEQKHKILIILQAIDTAGKDGTIRAVFEGVNPQGVLVSNFKGPSTEELKHDYLWRIHSQVPGTGELVIFNRSQYEDVLIVRVHNWIDEAECGRRYQQINDFERMLSEEGTTILKFFLHISKDEQKTRLLERIDTPEKQWKFSTNDLPERALWDGYMKAYENMLNATSTELAPWYVIPGNHNWYRNLRVAEIIVETLRGLKMEYPKPGVDLAPYRKQLEEET